MKNTPGMMGKKVGMTQIFDAEGNSVPVTVVQLGENVVTETRTKENNGYTAVQIGGFVVKEKKLNKPEKGALAKRELPMLKPLREFRVDDTSKFKIGEELNAEELFKPGMLVDVQGKSIGKGFQGTIKRYNAGRGPMAHGSKFHRSMGSIGPGTTPGRVFKGLHMPGQMGNVISTVRKLEVVRVDTEKRLLLVRGAIPGCDGGTVVVSPSVTKWNG
ncbi:MAG: 50S ribosomal protein L3 [Candidatus Obscuribacterales bacterium]|nr:50S ribosomal protein L3 [Candidatus Obscuribacterales bacterium]